MAKVTVLRSLLDEFKAALPKTGCSLTGRQRRPGKWRLGGGKVEIVDVEIQLPPLGWRGSMTEAVYELPGALMYGAQIFPAGLVGRLRELCYWHLGRSGL
jgi:hypothetical protein